jgi:hypothetical protein
MKRVMRLSGRVKRSDKRPSEMNIDWRRKLKNQSSASLSPWALCFQKAEGKNQNPGALGP